MGGLSFLCKVCLGLSFALCRVHMGKALSFVLCMVHIGQALSFVLCRAQMGKALPFLCVCRVQVGNATSCPSPSLWMVYVWLPVDCVHSPLLPTSCD